MDRLPELADLMRRRNGLDREIAAILDRPAHPGHFGEYVAAAVFGIDLNPSANAKGTDGTFASGVLSGNTVNVKYATKRDGLLNLGFSENPADHPDFYLVLTGPRAESFVFRGIEAPWVVAAGGAREPTRHGDQLPPRGLGRRDGVPRCPERALAPDQRPALRARPLRRGGNLTKPNRVSAKPPTPQASRPAHDRA